jgi:hypothetical protein
MVGIFRIGEKSVHSAGQGGALGNGTKKRE